MKKINPKYSALNKCRTIEDEIASNSDSCSAASSNSDEKNSQKRRSKSSDENGKTSNGSVELDS